jgi:uncharacterized sulfatase
MRDEETLASIIDFVPTVLNACGMKVPSDLPGIDLTNRQAITARKSVFVESYTHDIAALGQPEKSLVARVVINGWSKLLIPGQVNLDKTFSSSPSAIELFDLKSDPMEKNDLSAKNPEEVTRLKALQNAQWDAQKK